MNAKIPSRPKHLFVVKETTANRFRMVSVDNLTNEQRQFTNNLIAKSKAPGILVAAFADETIYNCRPLLLIDGILYLLRSSAAQLSIDIKRFKQLSSVFEALHSHHIPQKFKYFSTDAGQVFCLRHYFQHTLADEGLENLPVSPLHFAQILVKQIFELHTANLFHGHISLSNISFDESGPVLLDHGWILNYTENSSQIADLAPEQKLGEAASSTADIYGLGTVLKVILREETNPKVQQFIDRMCLTEPSARPNITQVKDVFSPKEKIDNVPTRIVHQIKLPTNSIASGKLIAKRDLQSNAIAIAQKSVQHTTKQNTLNLSVPGSAHLVEQLNLTNNVTVSENQEKQTNTTTFSSTFKISDATLTLLAVAVIAVLACLYKFGDFEERDQQLVTINTQMPLANYWSSNQPSLMQQVAQAALEGNTEAQMVIIADSLKGNSKPMVRGELLRTAFNPLWEKQLSQQDRLIALQLALSKLVNGSNKTTLIPLRQSHPAIILAVAGSLPDLNNLQGSNEFAAIPLDIFSKLPNPYSSMFQQLQQLGIGSMQHINARGLAHILCGDLSQTSVLALLAESQSKSAALAKIAILLPFLDRSTKTADIVFAAISGNPNQVLDLIQWFALEDFSEWSKVSKAQLIKVIVGLEDLEKLTVSQSADLLKFPDKIVRLNAVKQLSKISSAKHSQAAFHFLSSENNKLTRFQTISLIAALLSEGELGYSMLARFLDTTPDAPSILGVLLSRAGINKADPFSLDLSRYLARVEWQASLSDIQALSMHPERYARVLAYSRLDPDSPLHLKILQNAAVIEPHEGLRKLLTEKISTQQISTQKIPTENMPTQYSTNTSVAGVSKN